MDEQEKAVVWLLVITGVFFLWRGGLVSELINAITGVLK
jgi:hypothetical protein